MRTSARACALLTVLSVSALLAGCSGDNPVVAEGNLVTGGLTAGGEGQVTAALALSSTAVKAWQVENGAMPTAADFAAIPGATSNGGATVTYKATTTGFCLTGTSSGQPSVTRVWLEPGGLQAAGATC
jgi:hypothetical protein